MDRSAGQSQPFNVSPSAAGLADFDQNALRAMMDADRAAAEASIAAATGQPLSPAGLSMEQLVPQEIAATPSPVVSEAEVVATVAAVEAATASPEPTTSGLPQADSNLDDNTGVRPVRSAKDAINAMYAADPDKRLSSYLASTAKEIINASAAGNSVENPSADAKSASSLHHSSSQRRMESTRPSASAIFRMAKSKSERTPPPRPAVNSADPLLEVEAPVVVKRTKPKENSNTVPVVHTSLKLAPKKPPVVMKTRSATGSATRANNIRPAKGKIAVNVAKAAAAEPIADVSNTAKTVASIQKATAAALGLNKPVSAAAKTGTAKPRRTSAGRMMDVSRPGQRAQVSRVAPTAPIESSYTVKSSKSVAKPFRSVKERFRPAPKGFSASRSKDARAEVFADFSNPDHPIKAQHLSLPAPSSVDIYYEIDTTIPATKAQSQKNAEVGLGVVQDYRPQGDRVENGRYAETSIAGGHGAASPSQAVPDNNQYALGAQSPFFLKTVQVEKRPLSDGPKRSSVDVAGTVYAAPRYDDAKGKKGYDKKSTKKPKAKTKVKAKTTKIDKKALRQDIPTRPTVIVPPSRRSHAPLFLLLLATILLGAAVGALSYLCFFQ